MKYSIKQLWKKIGLEIKKSTGGSGTYLFESNTPQAMRSKANIKRWREEIERKSKLHYDYGKTAREIIVNATEVGAFISPDTGREEHIIGGVGNGRGAYFNVEKQMFLSMDVDPNDASEEDYSPAHTYEND